MGQVLMEDKSYDAAGQVLTGSFMDYAMPRAECPGARTGATQSRPRNLLPKFGSPRSDSRVPSRTVLPFSMT
jgi:hypothetical protein